MSNELMVVKKTLENSLPQISDAIPKTIKKYMSPERVTKIVLSEIAKQPKLAECTPKSIVSSVIHIVEMGLEPGGPLGQAYLVPFRNKRVTPPRMECVPIVGYRGWLSLAWRTGGLSTVFAGCVYEKDEFYLDLANQDIKHFPHLDGNRGLLKLVYSIAHFKDGGRHIEMMTRNEVDRIRKRSKASDNGPWITDYDEMARKTVVRRSSKYWPMSTEDLSQLSKAIENDADSIDVDYSVVNLADQETDSKPTRTHQVKKKLLENNARSEKKGKTATARPKTKPLTTKKISSPKENTSDEYTEEQWRKDFPDSAKFVDEMEAKYPDPPENPEQAELRRPELTLSGVLDVCEKYKIPSEVMKEIAEETGVDLNARHQDGNRLNDFAERINEWYGHSREESS